MRRLINNKNIYIITAIIVFILPHRIYAENTELTEATVEFTYGEGPTLPVNPDNPEEDLVDGNAITGSLAIVSVSDFNFGSIRVAGKTAFYDIVTGRPNIQVVDLRGSGTGWSVSAVVSRFKDSDEAFSLPGASIHVYDGRPNSLALTSSSPLQITGVELPADGSSVKVITAPERTPAGLWVMRWYPPTDSTDAYIKLEIPAGAATVGTHTAKINWVLSDTP